MKSESDLQILKQFIIDGKKQFPKNWIFYGQETKPDFMRDKPKTKKKKQKKAKVAENINSDVLLKE